jgi:two-component system NtrC family sensor kinase
LIFNPFHTSKRVGEGSGLGLSVSYGLIKKYGSDITVCSQQGERSTFSVWLLQIPKLREVESALMDRLQSTEQSLEAVASSWIQRKRSA